MGSDFELADFSMGMVGSDDSLSEPDAPVNTINADDGFEPLSAELLEVFSEEVHEIVEAQQTLIPQWIQSQNDEECLTDIRRNFHTLKGSGRMAGALALGDYAWTHESLLNKVLAGQLPMTPALSTVLDDARALLQERIAFLISARVTDESLQAIIQRVEQFPDMPALVHEPESKPESKPEPDEKDVVTEDEVTPDHSPVVDELSFVASIDDDATDAAVSEVQAITPVSNATVTLPNLDDSESRLIWRLFWEEFPEQLSELDEQLQQLQQDDHDLAGILQSVERALHTIKGSARMAQLNDVGDCAHQAEDMLTGLRSQGALNNDQLSSIQSYVDQLNTLAEDYDYGKRVASTEQAAPTEVAPESGESDAFTDFVIENESNSDDASDSLSTVVIAESGTDQRDAEAPVAEEAEALVFELEPEVASEQVSDADVQDEDTSTGVEEPEVFEPAVSLMTEESDESEDDTVPAPRSLALTPDSAGHHDSLLERMLSEQINDLPDITVLHNVVNTDMSVEDANQVTEPLLGAQEQIRLPAAFIDQIIEGSSNMNIQQNRLFERFHSMSGDVGELGLTVTRLRQLLRALELETEAQIHAGYRQLHQQMGQDDKFDPLEMDQYSEIQRLSRSLAESLNDLVNIEGDLSNQIRSSEQTLQESVQVGRKNSQQLLSTRLIEVNTIVPRLRRIVRQTANELGKSVVLDIEGMDCELDRHLLQQMTAPLEHLLRNAVSHGIEQPEARAEAGKTRDGQVYLQIFRDDLEIVIELRDDGRGINRERVRAKAIDLGLISAKTQLSDSDLDRLILRPGFSTSDQVSQISGRGVGMDVVYSEIKGMGGNLQIVSEPGKGAVFTMRLPSTMASNPVLFVDVRDQTYALPLGNIRGLMRLDGKALQAYLQQDDPMLVFNDEKFHLRYLGESLGVGSVRIDDEAAMMPVIFTHLNGNNVVWLVDRIGGRRDVVLQSLGVLFKDSRFYSSATVTSDGKVVLLPDMSELIRRTVLQKGQAMSESSIKKARRNAQPHILVVDDSITVRKVTETVLTSKRYIVETAKDGMDAVEKLDKFQPDLILLDIEMPRMDGFELLGRLRQQARWEHTPVIMISSRTAKKHRQHAMALGASDFIGKPYQNKALFERIVKHLEAANAQEKTREEVQA